MQLTRYSDYSLRVLMYLALNPKEMSTISEIADAYGISRNHLVKVVHNLSLQKFIKTSRGKQGGLWLDRKPEHINVGTVIRYTEANFNLAECFDMDQNTCPIAGFCSLQTVLGRASRQFLKELDKYTLADLVPNKRKLKSTLIPA
jgi:Rrf2 family nitric oxide-sensitive transcriptional repressor